MHTAAGGPVHSFTETSPLTNLLSNQKDFIKSFIIYLLNSSDMKKEDFSHKMVNVDGCYVNIGDCLLNYDSEFVVKCYVCTQITGKFEIERGGQFLVNTSFQIY